LRNYKETSHAKLFFQVFNRLAMLVNDEFKNEIKKAFHSSFEEAFVAGSDTSRWQFKEKSTLENLDTKEFYVLTMSSQLFRIFIFLHFSKNDDTEKFVSSVLNLTSAKLDEDKFYDYLGEVGNAFLGSIKRDLGKHIPSLGMSTPNRLSIDCLKYMKNLNSNFESHAISTFDDKVLFYSSVYLVADEELNIHIDRHSLENEVDSGELELF
tara:strand:- start:124418 stop:125047 length:630 start_codon:yes stop_codon:yes gene_type:complete